MLVNKTLAYENAKIEKLQNFFHPLIVVSDELIINNKIGSTIVKWIFKDEKPSSDVDDSDVSIAITTEEIEQENIIQNSLFLKTGIKKYERDFETVNNLVEEGTHELIETIINPDYEPTFNNIVNVNNCTIKINVDQEIREPQLDRHTQKIF